MDYRTCSGYTNGTWTVYSHDEIFDRMHFPSWCFQPGRDAPGRILRCKTCDQFRKTKNPPGEWEGLYMRNNDTGVEYNAAPGASSAPQPPPQPNPNPYIPPLPEKTAQDYAVEQYAEAIGPKPYRPPRTPLASVEDLRAAFAAPKEVETVKADDFDYEYVPTEGLEELWRAVVNATIVHGKPAKNIIFFGPSGSGKTRGAKHLADLVGLPFTKVDAASMTDPEAWFGSKEIVIEEGHSRTKYVPSTFALAIQQPGVTFIDEVTRSDDEHRNVLLPLTDGTGQVTNPITGEQLVRHPHNFIIMAGNRGMQFTGTFVMDPAFTSRALIEEFKYLKEEDERRILEQATGCDPDTAYVFAKFAADTRAKALGDPDFVPISTREVMNACDLVAEGLSRDYAARYAIMNASSPEGTSASVRNELENIWNGVRITRGELGEDEEADADTGDTGWKCPKHGGFKVVPAGVSKAGNPYNAFRACPIQMCEEAEPRPARRKPRMVVKGRAKRASAAGPKTCTQCSTVQPAGQNSFCIKCAAVLP